MLAGIGAQAAVRPPRRDHDDLAWTYFNGKTAARIVCDKLLHVDKSFAGPDFINFRRGPATVGRNFVDVPLAANHFFTDAPLGVGHTTEQKHALLKFLVMLWFAYIHRDRVNGIGSGGVRIAQAGTHGIERAQLYLRPEASFAVGEAEWLEGG